MQLLLGLVSFSIVGWDILPIPYLIFYQEYLNLKLCFRVICFCAKQTHILFSSSSNKAYTIFYFLVNSL